MKEKFPLKKFPLRIIKNKDNKCKAVTSIDKINDKDRNIQQELSYIESDYEILICAAKRLLSGIEENPKKKTDPRLYWLIGENINGFIKRIDALGFYLLKQNKTLADDIGLSESSTGKIISFRKRLPDISTVDPKTAWSKYRDNKIKPAG